MPESVAVPRVRAIAAGWVFACMVLSSVWCLTSSSHLGATFDEPTYVAAGLDRWRGGGIGGLMRLGTMPLPVDVVSLPVWIAERWRAQPFRLRTDGRGHVLDAADLHEVLPMARAATLFFWTILLIAVWRLGHQLAGHRGGALAVALVAAEPSLLAHASLATTDIALCAFLIAFAASMNAAGASHQSSTRTWIMPGVWFGLALLSKASALLFAPLIALAAWIGSASLLPWREFTRQLAKITSLGVAMGFIYCGSDWQTEQSFVEWAQALPPNPLASGLQWTAQHLAIFSNAGEGLVQQIKHNARGHDAFLLGEAYPRAVWFYFPVVLTIKTSTGVLLGLGAMLMLGRIERRNWVLLAAALVVLSSVVVRVQIGVRLILPVLPLALTGLAVALAVSAHRQKRSARAAVTGGALIVLLWSCASAWRVWPDALRFANELWGGSEEAFELVSDSNYDWGQGVPELHAWRKAHPTAPMLLWYLGTDPAARTGPWELLDLRAIAPADDEWIAALLHGRLLAVSATLRRGAILADEVRISPADEPARRTARALRRVIETREPIARTRTMFIYDFR